MNKWILATSVAFVLSGCAGAGLSGPSYVDISAPFDRAEAERQMKPGTNTISGSAFLRQRGGNIVTCAGEEVSLIPKTEYAQERLRILYGDRDSAFVSFDEMRFGGMVHPSNTLADGYRENMYISKCNAKGEFSFKNVQDGTWYITTGVAWEAGRAQGGFLMERVDVKGGEVKEVVLSF